MMIRMILANVISIAVLLSVGPAAADGGMGNHEAKGSAGYPITSSSLSFIIDDEEVYPIIEPTGSEPVSAAGWEELAGTSLFGGLT